MRHSLLSSQTNSPERCSAPVLSATPSSPFVVQVVVCRGRLVTDLDQSTYGLRNETHPRLKGRSYRLLDEDGVTCEALMQPAWQQIRQQLETTPVVLLVQDTTEVDLSHHPQTKGLGQVGNPLWRGLYRQTVLAIVPESGVEMGRAMQEPFVRKPAPAGETRSARSTTKRTGNGGVDASGDAPL